MRTLTYHRTRDPPTWRSREAFTSTSEFPDLAKFAAHAVILIWRDRLIRPLPFKLFHNLWSQRERKKYLSDARSFDPTLHLDELNILRHFPLIYSSLKFYVYDTESSNKSESIAIGYSNLSIRIFSQNTHASPTLFIKYC